MNVKVRNLTAADVRVLDYNPQHRYVLAVSEDALDMAEATHLVTYLRSIGANNVALIYVASGVPLDKAVSFFEIPQSGMLHYLKRLWSKISFRLTK